MDVSRLGIQVLITFNQFRFLKSCLKSYRKINPKIIVCVMEIPANAKYTDQFVPQIDILELADTWLFLNAYHKRRSWVWLCRYGLSILEESDVEYVLSTEGDCIVDKPEGIHEIFDLMKTDNSDIISGYKMGREVGTVTFLAIIDKAIKINNTMLSEKFFTRDTCWRIERSHGMSIRELGYVCSEVENPATFIFRDRESGTWGKVLGFRHLHAEAARLKGEGKDPLKIFSQFYDQRYIEGKKY